MKTKTKNNYPSVNFHLWEPCNFACKFCFATFQDVKKTILPKGHLPKEKALQIINELAIAGVEKITFVGGEPTLCPWIGDLIVHAKLKGMCTMIVTNGTGLNETLLEDVRGFLDWVVISIDSLSSETNQLSGRSLRNKIIPNETWYLEKVELVKHFGIKLKINTVTNRTNFMEASLGQFIKKTQPDRWKIFKALKVEGQNDEAFDEIKISDDEFKLFLALNRSRELEYAVTENNEEMSGTYLMIDPAGRFFDNTLGKHSYSRPILEIGVEKAMTEINFDYLRFIERGGLYAW